MDSVSELINQRGLIRVEHGKHGSRAWLWTQPETERVLGFKGQPMKAVAVPIRPYSCVLCSQLCALPSLSCNEKRDLGAEWTMYKQSHVEISGVIICADCRPSHPKLRIDSYRVSEGLGEDCSCTWDGLVLWNCVVCGARDRKLMSSRFLCESLRVLKPIGLFCNGILSRFSRHPYLGMREHEREAFLEANIPMLPRDGEEVKNRTLRKREELVRDIRWNDHGKDLTLTDLESMKWNFKLWQGPISKCFPEVDLRQGSRGKIAWVYVKRGDAWQVRSWVSLAMELAQGSDWVDSAPYKKDYRGAHLRSNLTKEKRPSTRKEKFVQLDVAPASDLDKHKAWCPVEERYVTGILYANEQITEEPKETYIVIMHFRINVLACAHPDYDWIGGIEVGLHEKQPEVKVIRKGFMRRSRWLVVEPRE